MAELKGKADANDQDWLDLKSRADTLLAYSIPAYDRYAYPDNSIPYAYQGLQWLEAAQVLGLAYKVTGNAAYAEKLKTLIDVIDSAGVEPITVDSGFPTRSVAYAMALMYDWLYDYLDSATKEAMISTINAYYASYKSGTGWYSVQGPAYDNYFAGHLLGFGTCAIATMDDNPRASEMLNDIRGKWDKAIPQAFDSGGYAGGAALESYNYGPNHFVRLILLGLAIKTYSGEDIYSDYCSKMAVNLLYNLKPNRWQSTDEGSMSGDYTGIMPQNLPIVLSGSTPGVAGEWMAYFYDDLAATPYEGATSEIQKADRFTRFLFKKNIRKTNYKLTEPLVHRSMGDEHVFIRSDWSDDAVWSSYAAGNIRYTGHEINKAGHIAIQRGSDYLLVASAQWKGEDGITGTPNNFSTQSRFANTLFFDDGGAYMYTGDQYVGGQGGLFPDMNSILQYETTDAYTYVKADHTNAYDIRSDSRDPERRSVQHFYRNFVKVGDKAFVVYDRVKALESSYVKKLYWHLNKKGQPVAIDGKTSSSTVGESRLFIKSVYPATSVVSFDVDLAGSGEQTTPRIEISDSLVSAEFNPLTVIIADGSASDMPETVGIDALSMLGVMIDEPLKKIVLLSKDGTRQDAVSYSSAAAGYHLLLDMEQGSYEIFKDDASMGRYDASDQGVLSFSSTGSGNADFRIEKK